MASEIHEELEKWPTISNFLFCTLWDVEPVIALPASFLPSVIVNSSQVSRMSTGSYKCLPHGPDCDTPFSWLAVALKFCCTKPTMSTVYHRLYDRYLPLAVLCSSLLLCWLSGSGQGSEVCYWSSVLGFLGLPTGRADMAGLLGDTDRQRNPRSSWVGDSFGKKSLSFHYLGFEQHWSHLSLACI